MARVGFPSHIPVAHHVLDGCPYPLFGVLGRGGQGNVHASEDPVSGAPLAVKVLHHGASRTARAALTREYQVLRELHHPAIPDVHGFGQLRDGRAWLALDYVEGRQSNDWVRSCGPANSAERCGAVAGMIARVADALGYLHDLGVVHGDVKPSNVLVTSDGAPRVLDLGGASLDLGSAAQGHGFYRTAAYAPAEHRGRERLHPTVDVFSLAATAIRLMTDRHPFGAGTREEVRARQEAGPPELDVPAENLPEGVRQLLLRCLSADPTARPVDGRAFATSLRDAIGVAQAPSEQPKADPSEGPPEAPDGTPGAVLTALVLAAGEGPSAVALATLCSGLEAPVGVVRRALDRLELSGWVSRDAGGQWCLGGPSLAKAQSLVDPRSTVHRMIAAHLADEWEGDPLSLGRAYCLQFVGRDAIAADLATRSVRQTLARADLSDVLTCGRALDAMSGLDERLTGAARTSWLLTRAHVAVLVELGDERADAWLAELLGGSEVDAERAAPLFHAIARWRGAPSTRHRPLAVAATELASDRLDAALALARTEVTFHLESGANELAAEAALIAGEALVALGRFDEGARALADAVAWWPGREGRGRVALARANALRALGRWGEAAALLRAAHVEAHTPWDRAAVTVGLAALATDCGHPRRARAWLGTLEMRTLRAQTRVHVACVAESLRALALSGESQRAAAEAAEPLVVACLEAGSRSLAARISTWQAAVVFHGDADDEAIALAQKAADTLAASGHRAWWVDADTLVRWLSRAAGGQAPEDTDASALAEEMKAWPLAMRSALADGDIQRAWSMATSFLAHLDPAQAAALELSPWAARARHAQRSSEGTP